MGRGPTKEYYQAMNENYVEGSLTCLKPEIVKSKISTDFPLVLNIEPTNACNAKCYYCIRRTMVKTQGINFMGLDVYRKIIDQINNKSLIMINFHKDGEPLLCADLPDMIEYAKNKEAANILHFNTNGILINDKIGRAVIERGVDDITISIDASYEKTYRRLKELNNLDKLESNIRKAIEYRNKINSPTKMRVKIMEFEDIEKEEIENFREKWTGIADEVQVTGIHTWSGAIEGLKCTDEQTDRRFPCAILWYALAINSNGKVSICNFDWNYEGVVGNVQENEIVEIWNSEAIKKIRRSQLEGIWDEPKVCEKCVGWVSTGDLWTFFQSQNKFI